MAHPVECYDGDNDRWQFDVLVNTVVSINKVVPRRARLLLGWATIGRQVNHLGSQLTTCINSAFHSSGVVKSSTDLPVVVKRVHQTVMCKVVFCV